MLPDSTSRTRAASHSGSSESSACAVVIMPGVQKPHCSAWCLRKLFCSGVRSASLESPSTVTTLAPSACTASIRQERTAAPSTSTVQAPHTPCSQPTWVPVRCNSWRRQSAKVRRGSTSTATAVPLTSNLMDMRRCLPERALDHGSDQRAAIVGAGVDVVRRIDRGGGGRVRLRDRGLVDLAPVEQRFDAGKPQRPVGNADDADMRVDRAAARVLVVEYGGRGQGEIPAPPGEFLKAPAPARGPARQPHLDDNLIGRERGGERAGEEIRRR